MEITKEEVEKIAKLSRLELSPEEKEKFSRELGRILEYINKLKEVETEKVEPLYQVVGVNNVSRDDKIFSSNESDKILNEAPEKEGRFFAIKKVFK